MPRSKDVTIAGKNVHIHEQKIKYLKNTLLPKIEPSWQKIVDGEVVDLVDNLGVQVNELFPELQGIDIEDCYPSEIEEFLEAWIEVNFTGVKRLLGPLLSLVKKGQQMQESGAADLSGSLITG